MNDNDFRTYQNEGNVWGEPKKPIAKKDHAFSAGMITGLVLGIGISVILSVIGLFYLGRDSLFPGLAGDPTGSAGGTASISDDDTVEKMQYLAGIIKNYFLWDVDEEDLINGAYKGMFEALGDPYSVYYTKEEYEALMEDSSGHYYGIGVQVSQDINTKAITVITVFDGSPAKEAGVQIEDVIVAVGGIDVTDMEVDDVVGLIKGEAETTVPITFLRGGTEVELEVTRRQIEVPTVTTEVLQDEIGYIIISSFDEVTEAQFKNAVDGLRNQGIEKVIIDLRYNGGGYLHIVVNMLDYLLPEGLIVYTEDRYGNREEETSDAEHSWEDAEIVILTNEYTASASEIFAGAMRDYGMATLVGTNTYGKGIVQNVVPLNDGSGLKLTISEYFTPSGFALHKVGLAPDVEIELAEDAVVYDEEHDNQLQKAIELLQ